MYKNKYLKYKNKYLNIKMANMSGGLTKKEIADGIISIKKMKEEDTDAIFKQRLQTYNLSHLPIITDFITHFPEYYLYLNAELKKEYKLALLYIDNHTERNRIFGNLPEELKNDQKFVKEAATKNGRILFEISKFGDDIDVVKAAVSNLPLSIKYANPIMRGNIDIANIILSSNDISSIQHLKNPALADETFIIAALKKYGKISEYMDKGLYNNRKVALAYFIHNSDSLDKFPLFKNDNDVVLAAVNKHGSNLQYASPELQNKKNIVLAAVNNHGSNFRFASPELKEDTDVIIQAFIQGGPDSLIGISDLKKNKIDKVMGDFMIKNKTIDASKQNTLIGLIKKELNKP